ncbi:GNAT family N-acetyltransferase [Halobacillus amylolyticus]|uniref:GNAT family N-acetyltransferase n=1 Tax=Halobacillus amylolyticus TaxID=2932259 RepID=A0ABY4HHH3_9BACI|nr:GNAT family protein [Halobacillus amylolyticus]UOR14026.1 GNAT family N-acetyltransferase [Halobacillus amylolyticus]
MIELRYFTENDFPQLMDWIKSPEFLLQWGGPMFQYPLDYEQLQDYVTDSNTEHASQFIYCVINKRTDTIVGHIALRNIDRTNKSARIGKVIVGDQTRGKGMGTTMMKEVLKIAFDELKLHKVSLGVFDFNEPAIRCYEKAGFKKDGLLRDHRKMNNEYWSLYEMSILDSEWQG